ncbi:predicted protein [Paecilomyces variotii No. 5]|uniref:Uncharacterized protein n=1 Tax=Byssochlamys spectabilis (strain No. 5 / NBRC 109023) TaxID=1356009 RepID=V5G885_BYSSN|nr:predicted protein [Paecilomyces variotii No. 5]
MSILQGSFDRGEGRYPEDIPSNFRYHPCYVLFQSGIPCQAWGADVLQHYGYACLAPEVLIVVVWNPAEASKVLQANGYLNTPTKTNRRVDPYWNKPPHWRGCPCWHLKTICAEVLAEALTGIYNCCGQGVLLLSAEKYNCPLPKTAEETKSMFPTLADNFGSLVTTIHNLQRAPATQYNYLCDLIISHVGIPEVWTRRFEAKVQHDLRGTRDFDIIVPNGYRDRARAQLVRNPHVFGSSRMLRSCWIKLDDSNYNVDILELRQISQENLQQNKILTIDGCRVLDPSLLLLSKRVSYEERSQGTNQDVKKDNDAEDIGFLVEYLGRQGDNMETNDDKIMEIAEGQ